MAHPGPYLINIRKYSPEEASGTIKNWLDRCSSLRRLDLSPNYIIKYNINTAEKWISALLHESDISQLTLKPSVKRE
jgi:hypothetical protein